MARNEGQVVTDCSRSRSRREGAQRRTRERSKADILGREEDLSCFREVLK